MLSAAVVAVVAVVVAAAVAVVVGAAFASAFAAQRDRRVGITKMHLRCLHVHDDDGGILASARISGNNKKKSPTKAKCCLC